MEPNFTLNIYGRSVSLFRPDRTTNMAATGNSYFWLADIQKPFLLKPHCQMEPNFTGSIYGRSFTKFPHFILIGLQIWLPQAILVSDWLIFQKPSPLKPHGQMEPNFTGSIYGRSFTKFPHFVFIRLQIWLPRAILVSDWLKSQTSSPKPLGPNETKLCRKHLWEVLCLITSWLDNKHGRHGQFLFLIGRYFKNLLLWNHIAKWTKTLQEAYMEGPLQSFFISSWLNYKYGPHRQFLFLIGW